VAPFPPAVEDYVPPASSGVSSISNSDGTLVISPTTGNAVASLNLAHANTWTALQTFGTNLSVLGAQFAGSAPTTDQVIQYNGTNWVAATIASGVSSVSNADGTLTISPTSGAVVASINLAHANTWGGAQTFTASATFSSGFAANADSSIEGSLALQTGVTHGDSQVLLIAYSSSSTLLGTNAAGRLSIDPANVFGGVVTANQVLDDGSGDMTVKATLTIANQLHFTNPSEGVEVWWGAGASGGAYIWVDTNNTNADAMQLNTSAETIAAGYTLSVAAVSNTSDGRLKPDFQPYDADVLQELRRVRFGRYSKMGYAGHLTSLGGFRAGVAAESLPPTVNEQDDDGWFHIRHPDSVAWLTGVCQALLRRIDQLEGELARKAS